MTKVITLEEGLSILEEGIAKARSILSGYPIKALFTSDELMKYYNCVYCMCTQKPPHEYGFQLYERYKRALEEGIVSMVLPSLMEKHDTLLLTELMHMWTKYKLMANCLSKFFQYIDCHFVESRHVPSLNIVSITCFRNQVCNTLFCKVRDTVIFLMNQERHGQQIDRALIKNVLTFFVEIGDYENRYYDNFEQVMLADVANQYSRFASEWLFAASPDQYAQKVNWCLDQEKIRANQYLSHETTVEKLLEVVRWQLTGESVSKLIEKKKAESHELATYQELLFNIGSMSLGEGSSASMLQ